jgi:hypothetical protein
LVSIPGRPQQIKWAIKCKTPYLLSFGCCYSRLHDEGGQNISQFSQQQRNPLVMGQAALTLAAHCHHPMSEKDYQMKVAVKSFRYALFLFLRERHNEKLFDPVGK